MNSDCDYHVIFENLANHSRDAVFLLIDSHVEFVNPQFERLFGFTGDETRTPDFDYQVLIAPASRKQAREYFRQSEAAQDEIDWVKLTVCHRDGHEIEVEVCFSHIQYQGKRMILGIVHDLTGRRQTAEREHVIISEQERNVRRYQALFEQSNDGIIIMNLDAKPLICNERGAEMFGYPTAEFLETPLDDLVIPEERPHVDAVWKKLMAGEVIPTYERTFRKKNGELLITEINIKIVYDSDGSPLHVQSIVHDITERKRIEAAETRQRLLAEALRDTAVVLNSTLDWDVVLDQILVQAARVVPHTTSTIALIEGSYVRIARCRGYAERGQNEDDILALRFPLVRPSNYHRIIESKRPFIIPDTHNWPDWIQTPEVAWIRSNLTAPIIVWDNVIGFLHVDSELPDHFNNDDAEALFAFATQAATAIQNARLYDQAASLNRATRFLFTSFTSTSLTGLGQQISQAVVEEFGQVDCGLLLLDRATGEIIRLARAGAYQVTTDIPLHLSGQGLVPEAIRTERTIYAPDVSQHASYLMNDSRTVSELVIPLITNQGVIGAFDLQSTRQDAFEEVDRMTLRAFAEWVALAIENMQHASTLEFFVQQRTQQLRETHEQIEAIFNYTSDAIVLIGLDGLIQRDNPAFYRLFKLEPKSSSSLSLAALVAPESAPEVEKVLSDVIVNNRPRHMEIMARRKDESLVTLEIALSPLQNADAQVTGIVCLMHDITHLKEAQAQLRHSLDQERKLHELKAHFFSRASHEFRTPLAVIMTSTELLNNYFDRMTPQQRTERINQIQTQVTKMVRLLENTTTLNRAISINPDRANVAINAVTICQQIITELEESIEHSHTIRFSYPSETVFIGIDEDALRHIINKLLENAVKFSSVGSLIQLSLQQDAQQTTLIVKDQGLGIPEEDQQLLFEVFYRGSNVKTNTGQDWD
ncbi:MAG: PAS domain S-box protein [Anaerolineae bacterium]|nr:PAS domain S-box protein [Anaerolineae bacterium]